MQRTLLKSRDGDGTSFPLTTGWTPSAAIQRSVTFIVCGTDLPLRQPGLPVSNLESTPHLKKCCRDWPRATADTSKDSDIFSFYLHPEKLPKKCCPFSTFGLATRPKSSSRFVVRSIKRLRS